jgi:hypothetical protein
MGWGINIYQDVNGYVRCDDADFKTGPGDYEDYPPCSYDLIYQGVEESHSEIDMARDEGSVHDARSRAWEAFEDAKRGWDMLTEDEQWKIHGEWMAKKREEVKGLVVDVEARKAKAEEIEKFRTKYGPRLKKLGGDILWLEDLLEKKRAKLAEAQGPLDALEAEYAAIVHPDVMKRKVQRMVHEEKDWAKK